MYTHVASQCCITILDCTPLPGSMRSAASVGRGPTNNPSLCKTGAGAWDTPAASSHGNGKGLTVPGVQNVHRSGEPSKQLLRPSFPFNLAFWAVISVYFGLVGLRFLHFGFVGLHFLSFLPCGPPFRLIFPLWAFISLHFGLVGLHFLSFWPCRPAFPVILAL